LSTELSFSVLKGTVVDSRYVASHFYYMTDKPGEDVNILEFKSRKPKYSEICLSLNKTQCASVEKEIIICLTQKKPFLPITAYSEGRTFSSPLKSQNGCSSIILESFTQYARVLFHINYKTTHCRFIRLWTSIWEKKIPAERGWYSKLQRIQSIIC